MNNFSKLVDIQGILRSIKLIKKIEGQYYNHHKLDSLAYRLIYLVVVHDIRKPLILVTEEPDVLILQWNKTGIELDIEDGTLFLSRDRIYNIYEEHTASLISHILNEGQ